MNKSYCVGIGKETSSYWEKRTPLNPIDCKKLLDNGINVVVQPSKIRCYSDDEYREIGAKISDDLSECDLIVYIQAPIDQPLVSSATYMFYSHTHKGQIKNPTFLNSLLEKNIRLIDYECIREQLPERKGKRLISFGRIAGIAGTINILKGIGELLLARQVSTPFTFTKLSYMYPSVDDALNSLETLGGYIKDQYLAEKYCPFIIGILGKGEVSSGVQEALKYLPHKLITPSELINGNLEKLRDTIYIVVFGLEDIYEKKNGEFNRAEFIKSPELYNSTFDKKYLRHINVLINGLYREQRYPKIITKENIKYMMSIHDCNLLAIADITCDLNGSIEILKRYTDYNEPFFIYEPILQKYISNVDDSTTEGILYLAIPNLAASFSLDASDYFSNKLVNYIQMLSKSNYPCRYEDQQNIPDEILHATITCNGLLTPLYKNIIKYSEDNNSLQSIVHEENGNYFISFKMRGHLFDSGFFHYLINSFNNLNHKINFLSIGDSTEVPSVLYFDVFANNKDNLKDFHKMIQESIDEHKLESEIIKNNVF